MNIRPSAAIRQNYNEIAELCRKTAEFEKTADRITDGLYGNNEIIRKGIITYFKVVFFIS